jgi:trehalose synthase
MSKTAAANGAVVIDDIIPAHTGKGPDWRLAERGYGDYPGLYTMVEIAEADWPLLPVVPPDRDSVNLGPDAVDRLLDLGYIAGQLSRTIFYAPGIKETDWSATGVVRGADGVDRRWVYLHYFKEGQPTLNWLDPSFAAPRLVIGDALHSLGVLGARMLRLDANGFLGVERRHAGRAWSEGHPLSITANQLIAGMVRRMGGFTFQELNLTVEDIASMGQGGADLSYDFITRPAAQHALVTENAEFLRLMLTTMHDCGIDPASLIHALQNHDELTLELVHFWTRHKDDSYTYAGRQWTGSELREHIRATMYERLSGANAPYNLRFVTNGVASTTASVVAAALGLRELDNLGLDQIAEIQRTHLLLVMYNAYQPGVFALSGWDLVGALPLPSSAVEHMMGDGDTRWIHRGAYDLMNVNPAAAISGAGMPKARALYGALTEQLQQPDSFANQLRRLLDVREQYRIYAGRQVAVPAVVSPGLLVMVHELPDGLGLQVTALNFGATPVSEVVGIAGAAAGRARNMLTDEDEGTVTASGELAIQLSGRQGKSYLLT